MSCWADESVIFDIILRVGVEEDFIILPFFFVSHALGGLCCLERDEMKE